MAGYYYKFGKCWEVEKLWEATKDNPTEYVNVEAFMNEGMQMYWNIGTFKQLAEEMKLVLNADYSYPIIFDEEDCIVDGAHRLVHAYIDGVKTIKGVIITNDQWPEPDYDESKVAKQYQDGKVQENIRGGLEKASHQR